MAKMLGPTFQLRQAKGRGRVDGLSFPPANVPGRAP